MCGLNDGFQHVMMMINLLQLMDFFLVRTFRALIKTILALSLDCKGNFKLFNTNGSDLKHSSAVVFKTGVSS